VSSIQSRDGKRQPIVDNPSTERCWLATEQLLVATEQLNVVAGGGDVGHVVTQMGLSGDAKVM
jgi:hypothetical protein